MEGSKRLAYADRIKSCSILLSLIPCVPPACLFTCSRGVRVRVRMFLSERARAHTYALVYVCPFAAAIDRQHMHVASRHAGIGR
jgi:hypothetical protein